MEFAGAIGDSDALKPTVYRNRLDRSGLFDLGNKRDVTAWLLEAWLLEALPNTC